MDFVALIVIRRDTSGSAMRTNPDVGPSSSSHSSRTHGRVDWLVVLEELFNFRAPAFPEVRSALAANRDLIDGPSPVSVLSLPLLRPGVCCKIDL